MKKILSFLLAAVLLAASLPVVFAAGSASFTGPGAVRAGDTITLTFSAGGGILGGQGTLSYDPSQLTLKSCTSSLGGSWNVTVPGNNGDGLLFYYDGSDMENDSIQRSTPIFKATFTVGALAEGTEIAVSVKNVILSAGDQDMPMGSKTYTATVLPPLSDNCTLASMTVGNAEISPAFDPAVTSYSASVPFTTSSLEIEAAAEHPGAKVTIGKTALTAGGTTTVKVTVKAENGAEKVYSIRVKREQDPNYVPSSDANLKSLAVEGFQLSPAFDPAVKQYYVWLPYEVENLTLSAETADKKAALEIGDASALVAGQRRDIKVTIIAEDDTTQVYTVTALRAPALSDTEDYLAGWVPAVEQETEPTEEPSEAPTQPVEIPADTKPVIQNQAGVDSSNFYIILIGACAACLILGLLIGLLIHSFSMKNIFLADEVEEEDETDEALKKEPESEFSESMPSFDLRDDKE